MNLTRCPHPFNIPNDPSNTTIPIISPAADALLWYPIPGCHAASGFDHNQPMAGLLAARARARAPAQLARRSFHCSHRRQQELSTTVAQLIASPVFGHDKLLHNTSSFPRCFISITCSKRSPRHSCEPLDDISMECSTSVDMCCSTEGARSAIAWCRSDVGSLMV